MAVSKMAQGVVTAAEVVKLKVSGLGFVAIGERLGMSDEGARKAFYRALEQTILATKDDADRLRAEETERLLYLIGRLRDLIEEETTSDPAVRLKAIAEARAISARLSALHGLDAPTRTQVTGKDGGPIQHAVGSLADVLRLGLSDESETPPAESNAPELAEVIDVAPATDGTSSGAGDEEG
jgi:hypothetical protein